MASYFATMVAAFEEFGLGPTARLYNLFDEALTDDGALRREVEGAVEVGMPKPEVERCLAWVRARAERGCKAARQDAGRTARTPPEQRTLVARRALETAFTAPGPLATQLMIGDADDVVGKRWPV